MGRTSAASSCVTHGRLPRVLTRRRLFDDDHAGWAAGTVVRPVGRHAKRLYEMTTTRPSVRAVSLVDQASDRNSDHDSCDLDVTPGSHLSQPTAWL